MAQATSNVYDRPIGSRKMEAAVRSGQTDRQVTDGIEIVYYLRLPSGVIKIGTTAHPLKRLQQHRRLFGDFEPLGIEHGGRSLETERHRQFAHLRVPGTREHFLPKQELIDHIDSLRMALGLSG